jgi:thiosulfate reductase/polysulfide reductase chain A
MSLTRREFLKRSSIAAGAITLLSGTKLKGMQKHSVNYPNGWVGRQRVKQVASICEMCFFRCGILGNVDKYGKLLKIDGNPVHPLTHGRICARGNAGHKLTYDPDRLKYPLLRVGKRGEGKYKRVSWDEALNFLAKKLDKIKQEYGPESVGFFPHGIQARFFEHLMRAYGTPNIVEPAFAQCRGSRDVGYRITFGNSIGSPEPVDFEKTDIIVLIGTHIGENVFTGQNLQFANALERGAKLIVVDPRFSVAAEKADYWLPLKPGTDIALLLAWMNVLIYENLYDKEYVRKLVIGFDQLKAHVKKYTPEWASKIIELPAGLIRESARAMGKLIPKVAFHMGRHVAWYGDDSQRARAMAILTALLGSYGTPGGVFLSSFIPAPQYPSPRYPEPAPRADGAGTIYPYGSLGLGVTNGLIEATYSEKPYPIKAWIVYSQNVIKSIPDPYKTKDAIDKLDLMVVVDVRPTEPFLYADLILPEATYLERYDDLYTVKSALEPFAALRQPVIEPLYESKPGWWIAKETAKRMGLEDYFQWDTIEDYLNYRLQDLGVTLNKIHADGIVVYDKGTPYLNLNKPVKFRTPSGKIELYSKQLKELDFDPMPVYEPVEEVPKGYFRLLYGRSPVHSFARTQNNEILHGYMPENNLWINNKIAEQLGLADEEYIVLENQDGVQSNKIKLNVTPGIRPDAVFMVHGFDTLSPFLHLAYGKGASDSQLMTRYKIDPLSGSTGMRVNYVRVIKNGKPIMVSGAVSVVGKFKSKNVVKPIKRKVIQIQQSNNQADEGC